MALSAAGRRVLADLRAGDIRQRSIPSRPADWASVLLGVLDSIQRDPVGGTKPYEFIGFGALDATKPYEFIGFGAVDATKPYEFIVFGAMDVTKPYEFIGFGATHRLREPPKEKPKLKAAD